jgi:hypothetical protein
VEYPTWLYVVAWVSLTTGFVSALYIAALVNRRPQKMGVMNIVWPVSGLYLGPIAVALFHIYQRRMQQKQPQEENAPDDFQTSVAVLHCGSGCTIGDVTGEFAVFALAAAVFGSALYAEFAADFVLAFALGIAFQYFSIVPMRNLKPVQGVKQAVRADFLSITSFEVGMFAWMAFSYFVVFDSPHVEASSPLHWFSMQIAMVLGFATAFPANAFLIKRGWKEKMG